MLPLYQLINKRILYNIPIGEKYFYSEMIMHTYELSSIFNKSGSLHCHFIISIAKYLCLTTYKLSNLKLYSSCKVSKFKYFLCYYYCVYANAQFNLCAKRLCGHQPCYHLELIS